MAAAKGFLPSSVASLELVALGVVSLLLPSYSLLDMGRDTLPNPKSNDRLLRQEQTYIVLGGFADSSEKFASTRASNYFGRTHLSIGCSAAFGSPAFVCMALECGLMTSNLSCRT